MHYLFNFGRIKTVRFFPVLCWKEVRSFPDNNVWASNNDLDPHLHLFGTTHNATQVVRDMETGESKKETIKHLSARKNSIKEDFIFGLVQQRFNKKRKDTPYCLAAIPRGAEYSENEDEIVSNKIVVFKNKLDFIPWLFGLLKVKNYTEK